MRCKFVLISGVVLLTLACGCATVDTFYVGDQAFDDRAAAEAKHRELVDRAEPAIPPTDAPVGGSALVVLPDRDLIERDGLRMTSGTRRKVSEDAIQYLVGYADLEFEYSYEVIKRRGLFDEVVLKRTASPAPPDPGAHDYVIYMQYPAPDSDDFESKWYVRGRDWPSAKLVPMKDDAVGRVPHTVGWLENLEDAVHGAE
jgi:hypothetical protein